MTNQNVETYYRKEYVDHRGRFAKHWSFVLPFRYDHDTAVKTPAVEYLILGMYHKNSAGYVKFHKQQHRTAIHKLFTRAVIYDYNFNPKFRIMQIHNRGQWIGVGDGPCTWSRIKRLHAGYHV